MEGEKMRSRNKRGTIAPKWSVEKTSLLESQGNIRKGGKESEDTNTVRTSAVQEIIHDWAKGFIILIKEKKV